MRCPGVRRREVLDAHAMRSGLYYLQDAACTVVHNNIHAGQCDIRNQNVRMRGDQCWMLRDCTAVLRNVIFTGETSTVLCGAAMLAACKRLKALSCVFRICTADP